MTIDEGKHVVEDYVNSIYKAGVKVVSCFRGKDGFVYLTRPNDVPEGKVTMGGYYKLLDNGKITGYSSVSDREEFRNGMKNLVKFKK